jgi:hypothetical protein
MNRDEIGQSACHWEQEIVDLVVSDRWRDEGDDLLRAHASECGACAETLELARLLQDDQRRMCDEAPVPSAGAVWWRASMRARAEAARTAGQPITLLQGIAAAMAVGLFVAFAGGWWRSAADLVSHVDTGSALMTSAAPALLLLLALAACLIVAPLAVYFATADEP